MGSGGAAPAGPPAVLSAPRARRKAVLLEKGVMGGQIALTELVENYPGIASINGFDLAQAMLKQAESFGMETPRPATRRSSRTRSRSWSGAATRRWTRGCSPRATSARP